VNRAKVATAKRQPTRHDGLTSPTVALTTAKLTPHVMATDSTAKAASHLDARPGLRRVVCWVGDHVSSVLQSSWSRSRLLAALPSPDGEVSITVDTPLPGDGSWPHLKRLKHAIHPARRLYGFAA
jgi:hypothetical protein